MPNDIIVGKHTLESLTLGMYSNPFTIYREYIQNSTDSIDLALEQKIIEPEKAKIFIDINKKIKTITINDNGTGISVNDSYKTLCDIGNSTKTHLKDRGFRGIGRLGGLGYCEKLIFKTSKIDEEQESIITWNCKKLHEMLQPGKYKEVDLIGVLKEVVSYNNGPAGKDDHYFSVILENINEEYLSLLDENEVEKYITTVAPIPFDYQKFIYAKEIKEKLLLLRGKLEEYNIYLNQSPQKMTKKYKTNFTTGVWEKNNQRDDISSIEFTEEFAEDGSLLYLSWIGLCNFRGTIQDEFMRGIRIRKGNILIGDEDTFNQFFTVEKNRANGVFTGEVYVFSPNIIPNARRDDFEKNQTYTYLLKKLSYFTDSINKNYRRGYSQVNSAIKKLNDNVKKLGELESSLLVDGITSETHKNTLLNEKNTIEKQIDESVEDLKKIREKGTSETVKVKEIDSLIDKHVELKDKIIQVENTIINKGYAGKQQLSFLSREQRKIYRIITEVIDSELEKNIAKDLNEKIILALRKGSK